MPEAKGKPVKFQHSEQILGIRSLFFSPMAQVRCRMEDGKPPCQRCQRRRVTCTLRKYDLPKDDKEKY